jgi:hypothetical protein
MDDIHIKVISKNRSPLAANTIEQSLSTPKYSSNCHLTCAVSLGFFVVFATAACFGKIVELLGLVGLSSGVGKCSQVVVKVREAEGEDERSDEKGNRQGDVWPDQERVGNDGREGEGNGVGNSLGKEADRVDESLHPSRGTGVGQFVGGNVHENLTDSRQDVQGNLPCDANGGDGVASRCLVTARRSGVDLCLDDSGDDHVGTVKEETNAHSRHGLERVAHLLTEWVQTPGDDGSSNDDGEGVEVVHDVVGNVVKNHRSRHVVLLITNTAVTQTIDRDKEEDVTGRQGLTDLLDKQVVPEDFGGVNVTVRLLDVGRLGKVPESVSALEDGPESTSLEKFFEDEVRLVGDGALWWGLVQALVADNEYDRHEHVDDSGLKEGQPETNETFRVRGGDSEETTDVDTPVEDKQVSSHSCLGVKNDSLTSLEGSEDRSFDGRLVTKKWAEGGLDETGSEGEDHEGNDKGCKRLGNRTRIDNTRKGGNDEQHVSESTDGGTDANGLEPTPFRVGDNTTKDGDDV